MPNPRVPDPAGARAAVLKAESDDLASLIDHLATAILHAKETP